jgi:aldehyde:ferredoxin oxidoreductase
MAFIDRISTLGRGGFGAVMGAKNLKAIVVRGTGALTVADRKSFLRLSRSLLHTIREYPYLREWQSLGMLKAFPMVPVEVYERLKTRRAACVSCPVGCKDVVQIPDGRFSGLVKHTSSAINLLTPLAYGMKDPWEAVKLVADLDSLGLDMFEFFGLMQLARELVAGGLLTLEPAEPQIDLASLESMTAWAERTARRQGTGNLLAEGFNGALASIGPEARRWAPALIKGMQPYAGPGAALPWDRFGTMELGQVLDPRGPHVGSGGSPTYFATRPLDVFPKHLKRMGVPDEAVDRILGPGRDELHVGRLLRYSHNWFVTLGCLGICARGQVNRFYDADLCAQAYEAATGIPTSTTELRRRADRVWTTLRELNVREGLDASQEAVPEVWFREPGFKDYLTGEPLTPEQAEEMKQEYVLEWGWK